MSRRHAHAGRFAGEYGEIDSLDLAFMRAKLAAGFSVQATAIMMGVAASDIEPFARLTLEAREPAPRLAPNALRASDFPDVTEILYHVAEQNGVSVADILGRSQTPEVVAARHEAIAVAWELNRFSLRDLGELFRKDHGTIVYGLKRHYERLRASGGRDLS